MQIRFLMQIPIQELQPSSEPDDLMPSLRKLSESDRDILEKGIRAFVSYIRGYKEHQCKYIFQMKDLDLGKLANACGLLQLPRMPEIRKLAGKVAGFTPSDVNPNLVEVRYYTILYYTIPYSWTEIFMNRNMMVDEEKQSCHWRVHNMNQSFHIVNKSQFSASIVLLSDIKMPYQCKSWCQLPILRLCPSQLYCLHSIV